MFVPEEYATRQDRSAAGAYVFASVTAPHAEVLSFTDGDGNTSIPWSGTT